MPTYRLGPFPVLEKHKCPSDPQLVELAKAASTQDDELCDGEVPEGFCTTCYARYHLLRGLPRLGREAAAKPIRSSREVESGLKDLMKRIHISSDPKSTD